MVVQAKVGLLSEDRQKKKETEKSFSSCRYEFLNQIEHL